MPSVLVAIANGTEEIEFATVFDILKRSACEVTVCASGNTNTVTLSRGLRVVCDISSESLNTDTFYDAVVMPGGMPGSETVSNDPKINQIVFNILKDVTHNPPTHIAMICAAPAMWSKQFNTKCDLSEVNIIPRGCCYPSCEELMGDKYVKGDLHVEEFKIGSYFITSSGPAHSIPWSLVTAAKIVGIEKVKEVSSDLLNLDCSWMKFV